MRIIVLTIIAFLHQGLFAQNKTMTTTELALQKLLAEGGVQNGSVAFMAYNLDNGQVIADHNAQKSMVPASIQKLFTTAMALDKLGKDFTFQTKINTDGTLADGAIKGNLYIMASGDPTMQSRYHEMQPSTLDRIKTALAPYQTLDGSLIIDLSKYNQHITPRGWIWEDIGNYFGATPTALMWKDNLLEVNLRSGQAGTRAMLAQQPDEDLEIEIQVMSSNEPGDNAWFFGAPMSKTIYAKGTIPAHQQKFTVKAAHPRPVEQFAQDVSKAAGYTSAKVQYDYNYIPHSAHQTIATLISPSLETIVKITNKRSINHYAEALVIELDSAKRYKSIEGGVAAMERQLKAQKVNLKGARLMDGSGLSPTNRITCQSMIDVLSLMYRSKNKDAFMISLPVAGESGTLSNSFNIAPLAGNLKAKTGTMTGVKNYAGYLKNKNGETVAFCLMLNDYDENRKAEVNRRVEELLSALYSD